MGIKKIVRSVVPASLLSAYHLALAHVGALVYGNPSSKLLVVAITGTKGKTSTSEYVAAILDAAGYKTTLINSVRFKVGSDSRPNSIGRSMPGRFFLQKFLARAVREKCTAAIVEMTSEGAAQHRHRCIELDALIFTNLAPEHIESHGSYEGYADAKFEIGKQLVRSKKRPRTIIANRDDKESARYLALPVERSLPFSLESNAPYESSESGGYFMFNDTRIPIHLPGTFSLKNALAAATLAQSLDIPTEVIARGLSGLTEIDGRVQEIRAGQPFLVVVDYAHTPDSIEAICDAYKNRKKICVFGATGGGRDTWKRPVMGRILEERCGHVIITDDDAHGEDPDKIIEHVVSEMKKRPDILPDRREAIKKALSLALPGDTVLILGMGSDRSITTRDGTVVPWSDAEVAKEELAALR